MKNILTVLVDNNFPASMTDDNMMRVSNSSLKLSTIVLSLIVMHLFSEHLLRKNHWNILCLPQLMYKFIELLSPPAQLITRVS